MEKLSSVTKNTDETSSRDLVLYSDPGSAPCRAVEWFVWEAGLRDFVSFHPTWLGKGQHKEEHFSKINPMKQVPAIQTTDSFCLSESQAILFYLAKKYDVYQHWFGTTLEEQTRTQFLLSWFPGNVRQKCTQYFWEMYIAPYLLSSEQPGKEKAKQLTQALDNMLHHLDTFIIGETRNYLVGDHLGVADVVFASELFALDVAHDKNSICEPYKNFLRWMNNLRSLESCKRANQTWNEVARHMRDHLRSAPAKVRGPPDTQEWMNKHEQQVLNYEK